MPFSDCSLFVVENLYTDLYSLAKNWLYKITLKVLKCAWTFLFGNWTANSMLAQLHVHRVCLKLVDHLRTEVQACDDSPVFLLFSKRARWSFKALKLLVVVYRNTCVVWRVEYNELFCEMQANQLFLVHASHTSALLVGASGQLYPLSTTMQFCKALRPWLVSCGWTM